MATKKNDAYERAKWKPGQSGNPKGTTKKQAHMRKIAAMTHQQMAEVGTLLISNNLEELRAIPKNPNASVLEVWMASVIMQAINKGNHQALDMIASRIVGRPRESIEISGPERGPIELMSTAEKEAKLMEILAKNKLLGDD